MTAHEGSQGNAPQGRTLGKPWCVSSGYVKQGAEMQMGIEHAGLLFLAKNCGPYAGLGEPLVIKAVVLHPGTFYHHPGNFFKKNL